MIYVTRQVPEKSFTLEKVSLIVNKQLYSRTHFSHSKDSSMRFTLPRLEANASQGADFGKCLHQTRLHLLV